LTIGHVLLYSPSDPDGLWIHKTIAAKLDARDMKKTRQGYETAVHNSRGVYWVDPEGKAELELAKKYKEKASLVEERGYCRFASTLRNIAQSYEREAQHRNTRDFLDD